MNPAPRSARAFAIDLLAPFRYWREGWRDALHGPFAFGLVPRAAVRVLSPDGSESVRNGGRRRPRAPGQAAFQAVVLPDDIVLYRELVLPALEGEALEKAVALEVAAASPFPAEDVAWGWRELPQADGRLRRVTVALASRKHVSHYLASLGDRLGPSPSEVWARTDEPILIRGFAEGRRLGHERNLRRASVGLLVTAFALAGALVAMPVYEKQQRAREAQRALAALEADMGKIVAAREAFERTNERARRLAAHVASRPDVLGLTSRLSELLPDGAHLNRLEIRAERVSISGKAMNAAELMTLLDGDAVFRDVRAPNIIALDPATGHESFTIEFTAAAPDPPGVRP